MANITLTNSFAVCPEGRHIFRIYRVDYDKDFGKLAIYLVNAQGLTHIERFSLMYQSGEINSKAYNAFSFFAKTAMNDFTLESIDHAELVNHYIGCEITHTVVPSTKDPAKSITFTNTGEKWVADGFDTKPVAKALSLGNESKPATENAADVDLNSLLN